jgi:hypothetical protein
MIWGSGMNRFSYRKKLVESAQVRTRDLDLRNWCLGAEVGGGRFLAQGQTVGLAADHLGIEQIPCSTVFDGLLDPSLRVLGHQLQHTDVLPATGMGAMAFFQGCP